MAVWYLAMQSIVFSKILENFSDDIKTEYGMTRKNFSTEPKADTEATFPFVYVHQLPTQEEMQDLDNVNVNAGLFGFQISVYDNDSQRRVREVMGEVIRIMKSMRFDVSIPEFEEKNTKEMTARFTRIIGSGQNIM